MNKNQKAKEKRKLEIAAMPVVYGKKVHLHGAIYETHFYLEAKLIHVIPPEIFQPSKNKKVIIVDGTNYRIEWQ